MKSIMRIAAICAIALISACSPPHVVKTGIFSGHPEEGYAWTSPDNVFSFAVTWKQGSRHSSAPHVHASEQEATWTLDDGYIWADPNKANDLNAKWGANMESSQYPHVVTSTTEGEWLPYPGYQWSDDNPSYPDSVSVRWAPGARWSGYPNVHAAAQEGMWIPDDGYRFVDPTKSLAVVRVETSNILPYGSASTDSGSDNPRQHFFNAIILSSICPKVDENSWEITRVISSACQQRANKEVDRAVQQIFEN